MADVAASAVALTVIGLKRSAERRADRCRLSAFD
jgi:hypothetical protein